MLVAVLFTFYPEHKYQQEETVFHKVHHLKLCSNEEVPVL